MAYEEIIIKIPDGRDLKFSGTIAAEITGGGKIYRLYETEGGNYVARAASINEELEETATTVAQVQLTEPVSAGQTSVFDFFGFGDLAKELYLAAGIDPYLTIE